MSPSHAELKPAKLWPRDVVRVGAVGLRTRPMRAFLSALGIAIGIAAMVSVVGISSSSRAELDGQLDALGTNLLTVSPGTTFTGDQAQLPVTSEAMVGRIGPVESQSAIGRVDDVSVYRTDRIPAVQTGGIVPYAARTDLRATTGAEVRSGKWLDAATIAQLIDAARRDIEPNHRGEMFRQRQSDRQPDIAKPDDGKSTFHVTGRL